jgi:hypothetical protein
MLRDSEVLKVARAIQPHLASLLGGNRDASAVAAALAELVRKGDAGESVSFEILELLSDDAATRTWARELLKVPATERAYEPLIGTDQGVTVWRYHCPEGDQAPWFRFDRRDEIPVCPVHGLPFTLADADA